MRLLALEAAQARASVALAEDGSTTAERHLAAGRGQAAMLAPAVAELLDQEGWARASLDAVAVCVGPGSFTGLRASIALAQGLAAGLGVPVLGVRVDEALAAAVPVEPERVLWVALDSFRAGRVFLAADGPFQAVEMAALPLPTGPIRLAGDAAAAVAAALRGRGADVTVLETHGPSARDVAAAGWRLLRGELAACPAQPLYIDAPQAKLPSGGLRPPPLPSPVGG
jgi:tRNA threonylcarbamoyladenosine biosynthesis protein TsaB